MRALRVMIEDLQATIDAQTDNKDISPRSHSYTKYNTLDDVRNTTTCHAISHCFLSNVHCPFLICNSPCLVIQVEAWISSISSSNPDLVSKQVIGNSYEGRPMTLLKVTITSCLGFSILHLFILIYMIFGTAKKHAHKGNKNYIVWSSMHLLCSEIK